MKLLWKNNKYRVGIILSGGTGGRFEAKLPKQYISLNGTLVIQYIIDAFKESKLFDKIIIVINKQYIKLLKNIEDVIFVPAGTTRTLSVANAIEACPINTAEVLFHDAARPFIKSSDLLQYIEALKKYKGVITAEQITDALYPKTENRACHRLIQTPEAFNFKYLKTYFNIKNSTVAIYQHLPANAAIKLISLTHTNLKITYPKDIYIAEQLMKYQEVIKRTSNVKGKYIFIFGKTGGIGTELFKQLQKMGAFVYGAGSEIDLSQELITFPTSLITNKWDCIIHSAGAYDNDVNITTKTYNKIMNVNFRSAVTLIRNCKGLLKPNGSLIFLGSVAAAKGRTGIALYSASKAALNAYVEGMAEPLKKDGFRINVICPAKVATKFQKKINPKADQSEMIQPKDLAKIVMSYIDAPVTGNVVYTRVGEV
jgi:2-C-methyl-D-erythritol 4-phosphate cytidylyltransferase